MPVTSKRSGTGEDKPGLKKASTTQQATPVTKTYHKDASGKLVPYSGVIYNDAPTPLWKKADTMHNNTRNSDTTKAPVVPAAKSRPRFSDSD